jgi:adenine phosphoribosyltransferase
MSDQTTHPAVDLRRHIRDIPDFPKPGVVFKDITPLLADGEAFHAAVDALVRPYRGRVDLVLGIESRGFIVGAAASYALGTGIAVVRKPGKLPWQTHRATYELEYGADALEIHHDGVRVGQRVLLVDDLLATGGTASAAIELIERCGGQVVACAFLIELSFLGGRSRLQGYEVHALVAY